MQHNLSLEEQFNLPLVKDLLEENKRITANLSTKIPDSKIENIKIPYVILRKLLLNEGEHNGVFYPKDEIMSKIQEADEASLILDHKDTAGEGASNWVGKIENPVWAIGEQGEGMYGDLVIIDKPTAQKLAAGAKLGISPTIDFERNELGDRVVASDLSWKSFSLVISPAVRATMLNSKNEGDVNMPGTDKKYPYKYPVKGKEPAACMEQIDLSDEKALQLLTERDSRIAELETSNKELSAKLEKFETAQRSEMVENLTASEFLIGRLDPSELEARSGELMKKSPEILSELRAVIGDHAELQSYKQFVKDFLKKNKGKSIKDAAAAWSKQKPAGKGKLEEEEDANSDNETSKATSTLQAASLIKPNTEVDGRELSQLQKAPQVTEADIAMLNFMTGGA